MLHQHTDWSHRITLAPAAESVPVARHFVRTQLEKRQVQIHLINTVIGHEKNQQEALGKFSSTSKKQVHDVRHTFEHIATDLALDNSIRFLEQQLHQLKEQ